MGSGCFAFDVVYPKKNDVTVNAKSTFFIGSSNAPLMINGQDVPLHSTGAFAYVVELKDGENTFVLQSENERKIFVITKPVIKSGCILSSQFVQYYDNKFYSVTVKGAPLRSTPIDAGINRMAHLQRDIVVAVDGEKNGFYRVVLGDDKFGWIAKSNVKLLEDYNFEYAEVLAVEQVDDNEYSTFTFCLSRQVPFEIVEDEQLRVNFYNVKGGYKMDLPIGDSGMYGYSGEYQGDNFVLKVRKPYVAKKNLRGLTVAVDAGHGGVEFGAIGCLGNKEKDITLSVAKFLETELKKRGAKVVMTRDEDVYVGLNDRVEKANSEDAIVLLSIHANALPDGFDPNKNSGTSIYYYYNQAKPLAETILDTMISQLGTNNDKVRQASFAVVRNTNALSLLIETAYLINPEDNAKLVDINFQKRCAKAIADGLEKYFSKASKM